VEAIEPVNKREREAKAKADDGGRGSKVKSERAERETRVIFRKGRGTRGFPKNLAISADLILCEMNFLRYGALNPSSVLSL
jgi:hypothetical protein